MKTNKYRTTESYSNTQCIVASDIFYKVLNVMTSKKMPKKLHISTTWLPY